LGSTVEVTPSPVLSGTEAIVLLTDGAVVRETSTGPTELRTLEAVVLTKMGSSVLVEVESTPVVRGAVVRGAAVEVSELVVLTKMGSTVLLEVESTPVVRGASVEVSELVVVVLP
jgi:ribosomal protein L30/L7E